MVLAKVESNADGILATKEGGCKSIVWSRSKSGIAMNAVGEICAMLV